MMQTKKVTPSAMSIFPYPYLDAITSPFATSQFINYNVHKTIQIIPRFEYSKVVVRKGLRGY